MPIRINKFDGLIPRLQPDKLPEEGAQIAHNCELTSGALVPVSVVNDPTANGVSGWIPATSTPKDSNVDENGLLKNEIPAEDLIRIAKPNPPSKKSVDYACKPAEWLSITAYAWKSWIHPTNGTYEVERYADNLEILDTRYTDTGLELVCKMHGFWANFDIDIPYSFRGPHYQFHFSQFSIGGPDETISHPNPVTLEDPELPGGNVPLTISAPGYGSHIYGSFQPIDVKGPKFDNEFLNTDFSPTVTYTFPGQDDRFVSGNEGIVTFIVNLNYVLRTRQHLFYVQSMLTSEDPGEEGPPSEVSELITVMPGQFLTLNTPFANIPDDEVGGGGLYNKNRLYRSATGTDNFLLVDDINLATVFEPRPFLQGEIIPPFGNYPAGVDKDQFLSGIVVHPAQFAVAFFEKTLYLSDIFRFWSWPDENTVPFQEDIVSIAITGNTILVFTTNEEGGGRVFGVSGSNPKIMSKYIISKAHPLLSQAGLAQLGQTAYYATDDGLAAANANGVSIITQNHFTKDQWQEFNPAAMAVSVEGRVVYAQAPTDFGVRFDLDSSLAVTTFGVEKSVPDRYPRFARSLVTPPVTVAEKTTHWKSRRYRFDQPTLFEYARIVADGEVDIIVTGGATTATYTIPDDTPVLLGQFEANDVTKNTGVVGAGGIPPEVINGSASPPRYAPPPAASDTDEEGITYMNHSREWEFEVRTNNTVRSMEFFERQVREAGSVVQLTPENTPVWESIWLEFPDRGHFVAGTCSFEGAGTATIKFHENGKVLRHTEAVTSGTVFSLPKTIADSDLWRVEVITTGKVNSLTLFAQQTQPVGKTLSEFKSIVQPWLFKRYECVDSQTFLKGLTVEAGGNITVNLYLNGSDTATTVLLTNDEEYRFDDIRCSSLEFDFGGDDYKVNKVLFTTRMVNQLPSGGAINMVNAQSWRGNLFSFPDRGKFVAAQVVADDYGIGENLDNESIGNVTMIIYADGVEVYNEIVQNGNAFELPRTLTEATLWEIDVIASTQVYSVTLLPRSQVQSGKIIRVGSNENGFPPWIHARYEFVGEEEVKSIIVRSDSYPVTMNTYIEGADESTRTMVIENAQEILLPTTYSEFDGFIGEVRAHAVDISFGADNHLINEVFLFAADTQQITSEGVSLSGSHTWRGLRYRFPDKGSFAACSIGASNYAGLNLILRADGVEVFNKAVGNADYFQLPRTLPEASLWEVDIADTEEIQTLNLIPLQVQDVAGTARWNKRANSPPPWFWQRVRFSERVNIKSAVVQSNSYPVTLEVYADGSETNSVSESRTRSTAQVVAATPPITTNRSSSGRYFVELGTPEPSTTSNYNGVVSDTDLNNEVPLDIWGTEFDIAFSAADTDEVRSVTLFADIEQGVGDTVTLEQPESIRRIRYKMVSPGSWGAIIVSADWYPESKPIIISLTDSDGIQYLRGISDGRPAYFAPTMTNHENWTLDIFCENAEQPKIRSVAIIPRQSIPTGTIVRERVGEMRLTPWSQKVYELDGGHQIANVRVDSTSETLTMRFYLDGSTTPTDVKITSGKEMRINLPRCESFKFDFGPDTGDYRSDGRGSNDTVNEVLIQMVRPIQMPANGAVIIKRDDIPYTWSSTRITAARPTAFSCARVLADYSGGATINLEFFVNGTRITNVVISSDDAIRLPQMRPEREWELAVTTSKPDMDIVELGVATSMGVLQRA